MDLSTRPAVGRFDPARPAPISLRLARSLLSIVHLVMTLGLLTVGANLQSSPAFAQDGPAAFRLDDVIAKAKALADRPYAAPAVNLPDVFSELRFADYQKIQPRRDKFAWTGVDTPFKLAFYHQGMQFKSPVRINEIVNGEAQEMLYDPSCFDFGDLKFDRSQTEKLGWAGFRILYPVNQAGKNDEVMSLLGASYFRVIGKGQVYGLSGRGLSIDTGLSIPEEFPHFREFWVSRPNPQDQNVKFYALLDSPRATGAYEFTLTIGTDTLLDVKARVFLRPGEKPPALGIAPLTSMFLHGPNQPPTIPNFRPAIHDSNGLAIHTGTDEWIWRPLNNPTVVSTSSFSVQTPKGFGLLQRGRDFSRFEDLKDRYDLRPSAWIEPVNDWGKGYVRLVEIPTADETNDNIVAFWVPDAIPAAGQPLQFDYRMHWTTDEPAILKGAQAYVWQTIRTIGEVYHTNLIRADDGTIAFLVDFSGQPLRDLPPDAPVDARVSANDNVEFVGSELRPNPVIGGWRLIYRIKIRDTSKASELRAALASGDRTLSETWSYQIPPSTPIMPAGPNRNPFKTIETTGGRSGQASK